MNGKDQNEHMFSGLPPKADLTDGPLFGSREQRREDRTPLFGQTSARRHLIALDQAADDHLLRRGVRNAGRLPVRV
jgi:hypothetical protein